MNKIFQPNLLVYLLIFPLFVFSQGEANNWYFGNGAGITFNSGNAIGLNNGNLFAFEGCSSISDANGNLLFYSDGRFVFNRNHLPMLNGTGLLGDASATQSGLIVPHPGNSNLFYVFSIDEEAGPNGIRYSVVDMTLDGGLGAVNSFKNILLYSPTSERITAVQHSNGNDIWIITRTSTGNEYKTFLIDNNGLNTTPISSFSGLNATTNVGDSIGYMKLSPDGTKLAVAYVDSRTLEIHDFNTSSGIVNNSIQLLDFDP
ncbi:MAG: hypothetical protein VX550_04320, partial [Bacteroidota bacterium]|nr:hypothetical protein [Bacteroidota bacterium]